MSNAQTRRTFLKLSAMGATATAIVDLGPRLTASVPAPQGDIAVRVTSGKLRYAKADSLAWRSAGGGNDNTILLDPSKKFQEMLGFGAAFTDAACYMFNQLDAPAREALFHELFHPSEMGLSVCRTCMGSSDYSTEVFSYDEGEPDLEMKRFSIAQDQAYVLPMLRQARKVNPDIFLLSSPWSPPGWMKAGGSMLGGSMRQHYYAPYAQYFVKFLQRKAFRCRRSPCRTKWTRIRMAGCRRASFRRNMKSGSSKNTLAPHCNRMACPQRSGFSTITTICGDARFANSTTRDCASIATRWPFMGMWALRR